MKTQSRVQYLFSEPAEPGAVRELAPGVKWLCMPLPFGLSHINLYLLKDGDGWLAIDAGMKGSLGRETWQRVVAEHLDGLPLTGLLVTHLHPDHIGLAGWLVAEYGCKFFMSFGEYYMARTFESQQGDQRDEWRDDHYALELGLPDDLVDELKHSSGGYGAYIEPVPYRFIRLAERDELQVGEYSWRVIIGRGHSPEHICLYSESLNMLIAGDQALPKVTANIGVIGTEPEANPLHDWFASMTKLRHLPQDVLVLPAHNAPYYGLHARLQEISDKQFERINACIQALKQPLTAYELMPVLYSKVLKGEQLMMAVAECLAHIRYLQAEGKIKRVSQPGEPARFKAVSA